MGARDHVQGRIPAAVRFCVLGLEPALHSTAGASTWDESTGRESITCVLIQSNLESLVLTQHLSQNRPKENLLQVIEFCNTPLSRKATARLLSCPSS